MNILITSGGTVVPIDPVRYIGNFSGGRFMSDLAYEFMMLGNNVHFFTSKHGKRPFSKFRFVNPFLRRYYSQTEYFTYQDYSDRLLSLLTEKKFDMVISGAAVSDFILEDPSESKIRSNNGKDLVIRLKPAKKIISEIKNIQPDTKLIGCKLLANSSYVDLMNAAEGCLRYNNCDAVIANDLSSLNKDHEVYIVRHIFQTIKYSAKKDTREIAINLLSI